MRAFSALAATGLLMIFVSIFGGWGQAQGAPCRPFSVYRGAAVPQPYVAPRGPWKEGAEDHLVALLGQEEAQPGLEAGYERWRQAGGGQWPWQRRVELLGCLLYYVTMDLDHDGVRDWSALVDGRLSTVLAPFDDDMDGDGLANVLDPEPLLLETHAREPVIRQPGVPLHLRLGGGLDQGEATQQGIAVLLEDQEVLYRRFGILAIDHTDHHAPLILGELRRILEHGLPPGMPQRLSGLRYVYAFSGHDARHDIAAYHRRLRAMSIGGERIYGTIARGPEGHNLGVAASLAHEIGHAFVFDCMGGGELAEVSRRFGGWGRVLDGGKERTDDLYDGVFFEEHPLKPVSDALIARRSLPWGAAKGRFRADNILSHYALTNVHEWFAEAFAAFVLRNMGQKGLYGPGWRRQLRVVPRRAGDYWANFDELQPAFARWLGERLGRGGCRV